MLIEITLTIPSGSLVGPFDLYSDVDNYTTAFDTNIPASSLVSGYTVDAPSNSNIIRVKSINDTCDNYIDIINICSPTTTTTTTPTPSTTTTTTTVDVYNYYYMEGCPGTIYSGLDRVVRTTSILTTSLTPNIADATSISGSCFFAKSTTTKATYDACDPSDLSCIDITGYTIVSGCNTCTGETTTTTTTLPPPLPVPVPVATTTTTTTLPIPTTTTTTTPPVPTPDCTYEASFTETTEAVVPQGSMVNTFVGYEWTGANFNVYTLDAVQTYLDFTITADSTNYPDRQPVLNTYSERQVVPTVNGQTLSWLISWDGDISTTYGGSGVCNLVLLDNTGVEHTVATSSFNIQGDTYVPLEMTPGRWAFVGSQYTRRGYSRGEIVEGTISDLSWQPQTNWIVRVIENDIVDNFILIQLRRSGSHEEPSIFDYIRFKTINDAGGVELTVLYYNNINLKTVQLENDGYTYVTYKWNYNTDAFFYNRKVEIDFNGRV
jgi:hypothetical protein